MKNHRPYISLCWLFLLPLCVTAQTASVQSGEARPASTPDRENRQDRAAQTKANSELQIELGASYESLSNGYADWQSYFLNVNKKFTSGQTLYGSASVVRRFDLTDPNLMIGLVQPLDDSKSWIATFEVSGSPRHQVLPAVSFYSQIEHNLGKGWLGHAGLRHSHYDTGTVNMGVFAVERYFKQFRGAYRLFVAHLNGAGTATSHLFQSNYYYTERNSVSLGVAFGQEIENIGAGRLVRTDVRDVSLYGRHWINQKWGLSYVASWHRQGEFYTRGGAQIGLLLSF